jgi:DNA-binding CsgD family transcriptional regulator
MTGNPVMKTGLTPEKPRAYTSTHPSEYVSIDVLRRLNRNEPFVGRDDEMRSLIANLDEVAEGTGRIVTLSGEPGIGKTRCAEELSIAALERNMTVLWGHCHESLATPPYWPWVEALESLMQGLDGEELTRILGRRTSVLTDLLPSLCEKIDDIPALQPISSLEAAQFRLFDALSGLIKTIAGERAVVIVLEDLNWADSQTLEFLEFFATRVGEMPAFILGTYRDVELSRKHPLSSTLGALVRTGAYERIALRRLTDDAMRAYIDGSLGSEVAGERKREVLERTEGNPFFLQETVRQLNDEPNAETIAEGIREALGRRLDRLPQETNELLSIAAIVGRDFTVDMLTWIDDELDVNSRITLLNEAVRLGLIEETATTFGGYRFSHALIQETLLEEIPLTRRVQMHAKVAKALEAHYGDACEEHAAELIYHFTNAQLLLGSDDVVRYAQIAGDRALSTHAFVEAARCFEIGLNCLADAPMDDVKAAISFGMGIACTAGTEALGRQYAEHDRILYLVEAFDFYRESGQTERAIQVATTSSHTPMTETALEMVGSGTIEEARLLCFRGKLLEESGDSNRATEAFDGAMALAERIGDLDLLITVSADRARAVWFWKPVDQTLKLIAESEQISGYGDVFARQSICELAGNVLSMIVGDSEKAQKYYEEAYRISKLTNRRPETVAQVIALHLCDQGKWVEARPFLDESSNLPFSILFRAQIAFETGDRKRGEECLSRLVVPNAPIDKTPGWREFGLAWKIPDLVRLGADRTFLEVAESSALMMLKSQPVLGVSPITSRMVPIYLAHIAAARGNVEATKERYTQVADEINQFSVAKRMRGFILYILADYSGALSEYRAVEAVYEQGNYLPLLAWVRFDIALTLMEIAGADSLQHARAALESAREIAANLGMIVLLKMTEEKKTELVSIEIKPVATDSHGDALPAGLTKREAEVLAHIAAGKTNQEISRDLYISEKTVHTHLTNIFAKLGVSNRTEAATSAIRLGIEPA